MDDLGKCNLFFDTQIDEILRGDPTDFSQDYLIDMIKYLREEVETSYRGFESFRLGMTKIKEALFGKNWMEKWNIYKDHDQQIIDEIIDKNLKFKQRLRTILFGEDCFDRMDLAQLTDEKLLEAVRMLKEVY